ncbi:D-alanyl-D-alanine carboxypeptidase/D-alanyl-D-alanine-endopeptidase [Caldimonas tepidiphila]|uniref:D-alanyl-D-alanine carboxypeptidase/D-alanyl-D-alanine endopeptidase n=1 Tax=Caldimonas tepidiphila TaxID=2315841 RepID=UPI000E5B35B2|nr:D-alanyl-D-alanine carboxypeptidase/D-alanyl-D-alanine-endopeptidase [Caldimonas tepidiphila]
MPRPALPCPQPARRRALRWGATLLGASLGLPLTACATPAAVAPLPSEVLAALRQAGIPAEAFSACVMPAEGGAPRLAHQERLAVNPASLMKLVTTYAGLELLGPAYTWRTPVFAHGRIADGVLEGDLHLRGEGDPKLALERLWLLLRRVQQLGVREVRGDIVLDRSAFELPETDPAGFDGEPLKPYNVQPDALLLNQKTLVFGFVPDAAAGLARVLSDPPLAGLRTEPAVPLDPGAPCGDWRGALRADFGDPQQPRFLGAYPLACGERSWTVAFPDPRSFNARAVEGLWRSLGGVLHGRVRDGTTPPGLPLLAESESPPLAEVVRDINKFSNNVMAQQLFLTLGRVRRGAGTPAAAREALREWLAAKWPGAETGLIVDNGSGLSRETRMSAAFLARLLQHAWATPVMAELMSSLPASGIDGTLRRSRVPAGVARLKTGSLRDVAGVAGYVLGESGRRHVLAAVIQHPQAGAARAALDALALWTHRDRD